MLRSLRAQPEIYKQLDTATRKITTGLREILERKGLPYTINQIGSMYSLFFTDQQVTNFDKAKTCDTKKFAAYFRSMLENGVYLAPSQFESLFISIAIGEAEIAKILEASEKSLG